MDNVRVMVCFHGTGVQVRIDNGGFSIFLFFLLTLEGQVATLYIEVAVNQREESNVVAALRSSTSTEAVWCTFGSPGQSHMGLETGGY